MDQTRDVAASDRLPTLTPCPLSHDEPRGRVGRDEMVRLFWSATFMRFVSAGCFLLLATGAWADWGGAHFCHLPDGRFVILKGQERYVLKQDAAWNLQDDSQKKGLARWLKASDLPTDLGILVSAAPASAELKLSGKVSAATAGGQPEIDLQAADGTLFAVPLVESGSSVKVGSEGNAKFSGFAKQLHVAPSSLLVSLSGMGGADVSESQAWAHLRKRLATGEFFIPLVARHALIWGQGESIKHQALGVKVASPIVGVPLTSARQTSNQVTKQPSSVFVYTTLLFALSTCVALIFLLDARGVRVPALSAFLAARKQAVEPPFKVSAHERELIQKVRDELKKGRLDPRAPDPEALVVGKMMESYDSFDQVVKERDSLESYRRFKEEHGEFQRSFEAAIAEGKAHKTNVTTLRKELESERGRLAALQSELEQAKIHNRGLEATLNDAQGLLGDFEGWCKGLNDRLETLGKESK